MAWQKKVDMAVGDNIVYDTAFVRYEQRLRKWVILWCVTATLCLIGWSMWAWKLQAQDEITREELPGKGIGWELIEAPDKNRWYLRESSIVAIHAIDPDDAEVLGHSTSIHVAGMSGPIMSRLTLEEIVKIIEVRHEREAAKNK